MASSTELTFELLLDWVEGRLTAEESSRVAQAVAAADETIQAQVAWLRAFEWVRESIVLAEPPPSVRAVLIQRFAEYAQAQQRPTLFQRIVAHLSFDSALRPAFAGLRSGDSAADRQLVFATAQADIVLNIQPRSQDEQVDLMGQVLLNQSAEADQLFVVQLMQATTEISITQTDELGEFSFTQLTVGVYQLIFCRDDFEIELPTVTLTR